MMRTGSTAALAVAFSNAFSNSVGPLLTKLGWAKFLMVDDVPQVQLFGVGREKGDKSN